MKKSKGENYLDKIPVIRENLNWDVDKDEQVTLYIDNKGLFNRIAQKLLKKPKVTQIHLEGQGNFVWTRIDGKKTVYDIANEVKEKYGDEAEPLYNRVVTYFHLLEGYGFISWK